MSLPPLRIATYNIHKGMSPLNGQVRLPEIAHNLHALATEVLFLQEVQGRHSHRAARFGDWPTKPSTITLPATCKPTPPMG